MLPKLTWPPTDLDELERTINKTPTGSGRSNKFDRGPRIRHATDRELDDLVEQFERELFADV